MCNSAALLHKFFQSVDKLVDDFISALTNAVCDTAAYVLCEQLTAECVKGGTHSGGLGEYIDAVGAVFHHALYPPDLPFDAAQAIDELFLFIIAAGFCFPRTAAAFGFAFIHSFSSPFDVMHILYTPTGYLSSTGYVFFYNKIWLISESISAIMILIGLRSIGLSSRKLRRYEMIEIKYSKSTAGIDNFFDFDNVQEYIPMSLSELRTDGSILKFYLSLFKKFDIIDKNATGFSFWWNTRFHCKYNDIEFELVHDNDWDVQSFCVNGKYIKDRETIAEAIKSLIESEGMNVVIDHKADIHDLNKVLFGI